MIKQPEIKQPVVKQPVVKQLDSIYYVKDFTCEVDSLSAYLKTHIWDDIDKNILSCFAAINNSMEVVGYYTLTTQTLSTNNSKSASVVFIGHLARDKKHRGTGLGEHLLIDALLRSYTLSKASIDSIGIAVDPIDAFVETLYAKYGFIKLHDSGKMFIPMNVVEQLI